MGAEAELGLESISPLWVVKSVVGASDIYSGSFS